MGPSGGRRKDLTVMATVTVLLTTCSAAVMWYRHRRRQVEAEQNGTMGPAPSIPSMNKASVPSNVWRSFEQAAHRIRSDKVLGKCLTNGDKLMFYGLFKQIVIGDAPTNSNYSKGINIVVEQAKHAAWTKMRGIPISVAMTHYLAAVQHFVDQKPSVSSQTTNLDDDDDDIYWTDATSNESLLAPAAVSRPEVENGCIDEEDDCDDNTDEMQLLYAAGRNDLVTLLDLLKTKDTLNVDHKDASGQTALHLAADKGCVECLAALIDAGADVNAQDKDGISVLQAAVIAGCVDICKLLLENGGDADKADADGDTPRSCALDDGDEAIKELFVA